MCLPEREQSRMICLTVSMKYRHVSDRRTVRRTDRHTDGHTDILRQHSALCIASRDKNREIYIPILYSIQRPCSGLVLEKKTRMMELAHTVKVSHFDTIPEHVKRTDRIAIIIARQQCCADAR